MVLRLHYNLEKLSMGLVGAIIVAASIGGLVEIAPLFTIDETVEIPADLRPLTPLELAGREIYMREGCYACHSQMVRSLAGHLLRVGLGKVPAEETPALLESKLRTARVETAPAHGLCLWKIHYGAIPGLPKPERT